MTRSYDFKTRLGAIALALIWTATSFAAALTPTPAYAQDKGGIYYRVELAAPASDRQIVANGVVWTCEGTRCVARKDNSRAITVCRALYRKTGEITGFVSDGQAMEAEALQRCNA